MQIGWKIMEGKCGWLSNTEEILPLQRENFSAELKEEFQRMTVPEFRWEMSIPHDPSKPQDFAPRRKKLAEVGLRRLVSVPRKTSHSISFRNEARKEPCDSELKAPILEARLAVMILIERTGLLFILWPTKIPRRVVVV
jgi:hypothetical protein